MIKPIILIMWGSCLDNAFSAHGNMLSKSYVAAITAAGGIPLMPLAQNNIEDYVKLADGILLPGGMGYVPRPELANSLKLERYSRQSDFESELYQAFRKTGKPILGICAGCQKINCEEGGDLILDFRKETGIEHHLGTTHEVTCTEDSLMAQIYGEKTVINSYHGFKLDKLGEGLTITMFSPEGIPEAIEHVGLPIVGTQWHPERTRGDFPNPPEAKSSDQLFSWFIERCRQQRYK